MSVINNPSYFSLPGKVEHFATRRNMHLALVFREAENPENAAITGQYQRSGAQSHCTVGGIPHGGVDRFTEDIRNFLKLHVPDFYLGDEFMIFHPALPREVLAGKIRSVENYCIGWAGMEERDKSFPW